MVSENLARIGQRGKIAEIARQFASYDPRRSNHRAPKIREEIIITKHRSPMNGINETLVYSPAIQISGESSEIEVLEMFDGSLSAFDTEAINQIIANVPQQLKVDFPELYFLITEGFNESEYHEQCARVTDSATGNWLGADESEEFFKQLNGSVYQW